MSRHLYLETMESRKEIHFAPVQGYTDSIYRNLHHSMFKGIDAYYTPFIRLEKGHEFRPRDLRDCDPSVNTVERLIPQVLGGEPGELRLALTMLREKGFQQSDINLGCPFPMIARKGKGAGLLPFPEKVKALLDILGEFKDITCSLKMRLGMERPDECLALLPVLNEAPLSAVFVHARVGVQEYKGEVNLDAFDRFLEGCHLPLYYNGDLKTTQDIQTIMERFPSLRGVMIGRGLLANPALAEEYLEGKSLTAGERLTRFRAFHDALLAAYAERLQGDAHLLMKMKTFWEEFMPWADRKALKKIHKSTKMSQYHEAVLMAFTGDRAEV